MKYKINDQYEIDSLDVTGLTFKLVRVVKNGRSGVAFFSGIDKMKTYFDRYHPDLLNDKTLSLIEANNKLHKVIDVDVLKVKHDINFYIDDFYSVEFDNGSYILYVHPNLNGNPGGDGGVPAPNKDRKKIVCYPVNIKSAIELYYNQVLRDCELEGDVFIDKIKSMITSVTTKVNELTNLVSVKANELTNLVSVKA